MAIPFVIGNQQHRMSDALNELFAQTEGKQNTTLDPGPKAPKGLG